MREGDWSAALFYNSELAVALSDLAALAGTKLVPARAICEVGPDGRVVREVFLRQPLAQSDYEVPVLWDHLTTRQVSMTGVADVSATPKRGMEARARELAAKGSRLLVANRVRTNTVRATACRSEEPLLGSAWVPVSPLEPDPILEKALCTWWNSTPGILSFLGGRAKSLDYARFALETLRALLVPSPVAADILPLAEAYDACRDRTLLPWPEMNRCSVRADLDLAAARAVGIDGRRIQRWRELIVREPTVSQAPAL